MIASAAAQAHGPAAAALLARPAAPCRQRAPHRGQVFAASRQACLGRRHARIAASASSGAAVSTVESAAPVAIPTNLNTIPHARETRKWFYSDLTSAVMRALEAGETRVIARSTFPELNTEFDVYRIGTLLEAVREVAAALAAQGKRVRVCVQQPLGQGVFAGTPLSLNGVSRILRQMDWGACADQISFGSVTADEVNDEADVFLLIAPQNIVGHSILPFLQEMTAAAGAAGKPMILINPKLSDIQSAGGVMSIRGRQERMDFVDTYTVAYHFRLLYKGVTMYPIMGALRHSFGGPWEVFRRVQLAPGEEEYRLIGSFEQEPKPPAITDAFRAAWAAQQAQ